MSEMTDLDRKEVDKLLVKEETQATLCAGITTVNGK